MYQQDQRQQSVFIKCQKCQIKPATIRYFDSQRIERIYFKYCYTCDSAVYKNRDYKHLSREIIPYSEMFQISTQTEQSQISQSTQFQSLPYRSPSKFSSFSSQQSQAQYSQPPQTFNNNNLSASSVYTSQIQQQRPQSNQFSQSQIQTPSSNLFQNLGQQPQLLNQVNSPSNELERQRREQKKQEIFNRISELDSKLSPNKQSKVIETRIQNYYSPTQQRLPSEDNFNQNQQPQFIQQRQQQQEEETFQPQIQQQQQQQIQQQKNITQAQKQLQQEKDEGSQLLKDLQEQQIAVEQQQDKEIFKLYELKISKYEEIIEELKKQLLYTREETLTKMKQLALQYQKEREEHENNIQKITALYREEEKKNKELVEQCKLFQTSFDKQKDEMTNALNQIKRNYETKLIEFEALLTESAQKIEEMQTSTAANDPMLKALSEDPELVEQLKQMLQGNNDPQFSQKLEEMDVLLTKKDHIIKELSQNSDLKDQEISKMEELIENFKALYGHMQEEKQLMEADTQRTKLENKALKELFKQITGQSLDDENEEEQNGEEAEEKEEAENDENNQEQQNDAVQQNKQ